MGNFEQGLVNMVAIDRTQEMKRQKLVVIISHHQVQRYGEVNIKNEYILSLH